MANSEPFADGFEYLHEHVKDLRQQVMEASAAPQTLLDVAFETMNSTIEELRVAEEEMRQQNEALAMVQVRMETWRHHYEDLFESAPDAYLVTDLEGVIQEANQAAVSLLGLSKRFLKGKPFATFIPEADRQAFRLLLLETAQSGEMVECDIQIKPRHRASLPAAVVRDPLGRPNGLRWLVRDLTDRNQAEADRYRLLVEEVTDYAIILLDAEGRVLNWNPGAERLFGYTEAEACEEDYSFIFLPEDQERGMMPACCWPGGCSPVR